MGRAQSINTFSKGLQKDLAKHLIPKDQYTNLENFRLTTSGGFSNGAIENIKGMLDSTTFSDTSPVYKLLLDYKYLRNNSPQTITLTVGSNSVTTVITSATTYELLYNAINATAIASIASVTYSDSQILITTPDGYTGVITSSVVGNGVALTIDVPAQTNIHPIGYTQIRDDIYVFSTSASNYLPGVSTNPNAGQIWKLTYNKLTLAVTLELIYNNYLNFSLSHPIPVNAATGRYENNLTQKIYFTDNYNTPRTLNVADPNVFATSVANLNIQPLIKASIPILSEIAGGGNLVGGTYQACYRLKNTGGAESNFSPISNLVNVIANAEDATGDRNAWRDYQGDALGTNTSKSIKWHIQNLDTNYDRIEFVVIYRDKISDAPTSITRVFDEPVPDNGEIDFQVTDLATGVALTLIELNGFNSTFDTVKTLATKDNKLFMANTTSRKPDVDYDARAYRFPSSTLVANQATTVVQDTTGSATTLTANYNTTDGTYTITNPGDTHDSICPNTWLDTNANYIAGYKYKLKPSGGSELGGTGENISYKFGTYCIKGDSSVQLPNIGSNETSPFRLTQPRYQASKFNTATGENLGIVGQDYNLRNTDDGVKFAYRASLLKGYKRNEVYRFGIQFFDKQMRPMYVKWIGDIKMPDYWDNNSNPDPQAVLAGISDFRTSFMGTSSTDGANSSAAGSGTSWLQILYVDFEVRLPDNILDQVGAFDIVRCERKFKDKRILDSGYLIGSTSSGSNAWLPKVFNGGANNDGGFAFNDKTAASNIYNSSSLCTYQGIEHLIRNSYGYVIGDQIRLTEVGVRDNTTGNVYPGAGTNDYNVMKSYSIVRPSLFGASPTINNTLTGAATVQEAGDVNVGGIQYFNYTTESATTSSTIGNKALVVKFSAGLSFPNEQSYSIYLADYYRPTVLQYNGNSYTQRSTCEYISCGQLQILNEFNVIGTNTIFTLHTFGGDIFTTIVDNQRGFCNFQQNGTGRGIAATKRSMTFYFPNESTINTELRAADTFNTSLNNDLGNAASGYESFEYNNVYSNENNIRKYIPKPAEFIDVEEFDNRVYYSGTKINGELRDNWMNFKTNDFYDVEGSYGPINALEILQNNMLFLQDNAFGALSINPKILIPDSTGGEIQVQSGTGKVITRHDYISTEAGCKHQWGITKSGTTLFWFDINNKRFYRYKGQGPEPLSDVKGLASYFNNNLLYNVITTDNPILATPITINGVVHEFNAGITATYDFRYNEALFTFFDYTYSKGTVPNTDTQTTFKTTVVYNELIDNFTGFYTHYPKLYINDHITILSCDPTISTNRTGYTNNNLFMHDKGNYGVFYNTINPAKLGFISNDSPLDTKVFDNLEWTCESKDMTSGTAQDVLNDTFQSIQCTNDYQNTTSVLLDPYAIGPNIVRKERGFRIAVPRNQVDYNQNLITTGYTASQINEPTDLSNTTTNKSFGERMRDKYMIVDLIYNNLNNYKLVVLDIKSIFRGSYR